MCTHLRIGSYAPDMTVDIHVSRSKNLTLNSSRSTDVNTKYQQQQQTNNLNKIH